MGDWRDLRNVETTGRYRFRINRDWRGRQTLVLQMQLRGTYTSCVAGHVDTEWVRAWRDARLEDMAIEGALPRFELKRDDAA